MNISLFLGVGVILLPFYIKFANVVDIRSSQNLFFCFLCFVSFLMYGINTKCKETKLFGLFFICGSFFLSEHQYFNYTFWQWILTSLGIVLFIQLKGKSLDQDIIEKFFLISLAIQITWVFLNYFGFDPYGSLINILFDGYSTVQKGDGKWILMKNKMITGSLGHPTTTGAFIACLIPFTLKNKRFYLFSLSVVSLFMLESSMSFLSAVVGLFYVFTSFFKLKTKVVAWFLLFLTGLFLAIYGHFSGGYFSDSARLELWSNVIFNYNGAITFFGNGPGWLEAISKPIAQGRERLIPEHNEYLTILFQYGVIGLSLTFYFLIKNMRKFANGDVYLVASIMAIAFNALGSFPLHISAIAFIFIINMSLILKEN